MAGLFHLFLKKNYIISVEDDEKRKEYFMAYTSFVADIERRLLLCGLIPFVAAEKAKSFRGFYVNENTYVEPKAIVSKILNNMDSNFFTPKQQEYIRENYDLPKDWIVEVA